MSHVLEFSDVSLRYGDHQVLEHFNLCLDKGQTVVVMGASGSGKTSVLRLAAGLTSPTSGKVINAAKQTAVQFQEPRLLPQMTALENVNFVLSGKKDTLDTAQKWLSLVELSDAAHLKPSELSGGMAQRVALARALAHGGDLYLLDEPFRGMDEGLKIRMMDLVKRHTAGASLLLITHDGTVAHAFSDHPLLIKDSGVGIRE